MTIKNPVPATYELNLTKHYETIVFGCETRTKVTAESLAFYKATAGLDSPSPGTLAILRLAESLSINPD